MLLMAFVGALGGLILGFGLASFMWGKRSVGTLVFHKEKDSDEPPVMAAVLDEPVESISKLEYVVFKVSQK